MPAGDIRVFTGLGIECGDECKMLLDQHTEKK